MILVPSLCTLDEGLYRGGGGGGGPEFGIQ